MKCDMTMGQCVQERVDEKFSRFDHALTEIEQWLVQNGVPYRATGILLRDRTRRYYVRLNIGPTGAEPYARVALDFWKFVARKLPLQPIFVGQLGSADFNAHSVLKQASKSWIIVIDPDQSLSPSEFPTFEEWCTRHEATRRTDAGHARKKVAPVVNEPAGIAQSNELPKLAQSLIASCL